MELTLYFNVAEGPDIIHKSCIVEVPEDALVDLAARYLCIRLPVYLKDSKHEEYSSVEIGDHTITFKEIL